MRVFTNKANRLSSLTELFRIDEPPPRNKLEAFWHWLVSKIRMYVDASSHILMVLF